MNEDVAMRVTSDLLLVGSLPADSTEAASRAGAEHFADLVFALPDGETGPRAAWVGYERERLARPNPDVVVVEETASPTGIPRHAYETPVFAIREGVEALQWDTWPRIADAIASYEGFRRRRGRVGGGVPAGGGGGGDPGGLALPGGPAVSRQRVERVQGRVRPRLPD